MSQPKTDAEVIIQLKKVITSHRVISTGMRTLRSQGTANEKKIIDVMTECSDAYAETLDDIVGGLGVIAMYRKDADVEAIVKALAS